MSLATYGITRERETDVARLLRRHWGQLHAGHPYARVYWTVGALVCDQRGNVRRGRLHNALIDEAVTARAVAVLAVVRWQRDPDDGAYDPARHG